MYAIFTCQCSLNGFLWCLIMYRWLDRKLVIISPFACVRRRKSSIISSSSYSQINLLLNALTNDFHVRTRFFPVLNRRVATLPNTRGRAAKSSLSLESAPYTHSSSCSRKDSGSSLRFSPLNLFPYDRAADRLLFLFSNFFHFKSSDSLALPITLSIDLLRVFRGGSVKVVRAQVDFCLSIRRSPLAARSRSARCCCCRHAVSFARAAFSTLHSRSLRSKSLATCSDSHFPLPDPALRRSTQAMQNWCPHLFRSSHVNPSWGVPLLLRPCQRRNHLRRMHIITRAAHPANNSCRIILPFLTVIYSRS